MPEQLIADRRSIDNRECKPFSIRLSAIVGRLVAVVLLAGGLASAAEYYVQNGKSWQKSDFLCETADKVAWVDPDGFEKYILKSDPSHVQKFFQEYDPDRASSARFDVFGFVQRGPRQFGWDRGPEDYGGREAYDKAWREHGEAMDRQYQEEKRTGIAANLPPNPHEVTNQCRLIEDIVVSCITSRRAIYLVNLGENRYGYRSFDFTANYGPDPSTSIDGAAFASADGKTGNVKYTFQKAGFEYRLEQLEALPAIQPRISVYRNGEQVQVEACRYYSSNLNNAIPSLPERAATK
jgi:hypothetical protein